MEVYERWRNYKEKLVSEKTGKQEIEMPYTIPIRPHNIQLHLFSHFLFPIPNPILIPSWPASDNTNYNGFIVAHKNSPILHFFSFLGDINIVILIHISLIPDSNWGFSSRVGVHRNSTEGAPCNMSIRF